MAQDLAAETESVPAHPRLTQGVNLGHAKARKVAEAAAAAERRAQLEKELAQMKDRERRRANVQLPPNLHAIAQYHRQQILANQWAEYFAQNPEAYYQYYGQAYGGD